MASTMANIHRRKGAKPFQPRDFMAFEEKAPARPSKAAPLSEQVKAVFAAFPRKEK